MTADHPDAYESHVELEIAATADNAEEAAIMGGLLSEAGIRWMTAPEAAAQGCCRQSVARSTSGRTIWIGRKRSFKTSVETDADVCARVL